MGKKVHADLSLCQGYANCVVRAPDHFTIDDQGRVDVLVVEVDAADESAVREAVSSCPVRALSLVTD